MKTIAILGASTDRAKFGNKAVRAFSDEGFTVYPVNPSAKDVEGHAAYAALADVPADTVDIVTVYLPPKIGLAVLGEIAKKKPGEVWFNPGAESAEILAEAKRLGLKALAACSLVGYGISPSRY